VDRTVVAVLLQAAEDRQRQHGQAAEHVQSVAHACIKIMVLP
jgi:hypothetical protein